MRWPTYNLLGDNKQKILLTFFRLNNKNFNKYSAKAAVKLTTAFFYAQKEQKKRLYWVK